MSVHLHTDTWSDEVANPVADPNAGAQQNDRRPGNPETPPMRHRAFAFSTFSSLANLVKLIMFTLRLRHRVHAALGRVARRFGVGLCAFSIVCTVAETWLLFQQGAEVHAKS